MAPAHAPTVLPGVVAGEGKGLTSDTQAPLPFASGKPLVRWAARAVRSMERHGAAPQSYSLLMKSARLGLFKLTGMYSKTAVPTVFCLRLMVEVGLKAILATMSSPFDRPPWMPPDLHAHDAHIPYTHSMQAPHKSSTDRQTRRPTQGDHHRISCILG